MHVPAVVFIGILSLIFPYSKLTRPHVHMHRKRDVTLRNVLAVRHHTNTFWGVVIYHSETMPLHWLHLCSIWEITSTVTGWIFSLTFPLKSHNTMEYTVHVAIIQGKPEPTRNRKQCTSSC